MIELSLLNLFILLASALVGALIGRFILFPFLIICEEISNEILSLINIHFINKYK